MINRVQLSVTLNKDTLKLIEDSCPKDKNKSRYVEMLIEEALQTKVDIERAIGEAK